MYDWLADTLSDSSQVVTASRRLARVLIAEYGRQQVAQGRTAWRSPQILSLQDWLGSLIATANAPEALPTRINTHQSRVLWEKCLRREISDPLLNTAMLVRQSRDAWLRLHEYRVPLIECDRAAQGKDQKLFAKAAKNYQAVLDSERWVDDTGIPDLLESLLRSGNVAMPSQVTIAGFDRVTPQIESVFEALRAAGSRVDAAPGPNTRDDGVLFAYESAEAELRAAGSWAGRELESSTQLNIAIVAANLEQNAQRYARLLSEGLVPGWQFSGTQHAAAVNVSYGRKLSAYPAIAIALLALRWLHSDLTSRDIGLLLRTSMIGSQDVSGRCRLEMIVRQLPERNWSPEMLLSELKDRDDTPDAIDWLSRVGALQETRSQLPRRATPPSWAVLINDVLKSLNWPGEETLDSLEFQLINRWRELLNDLARLELVSPTMTAGEVLGRIATMANETVFQPEASGAVVQLIGPLEAAGMHFDKLWISGLSASNWPPPARPSPLISRQLQRQYGLPNADPENTLKYARRVLMRLNQSATNVVCSYAQADGDGEQAETALLAELGTTIAQGPPDPGWHATSLVGPTKPLTTVPDPVPAVSADEVVSGGAGIIQRQANEPIAAFAYGRLGVRSLPTIGVGLPALLRGNLIHDTLRRLYADLPSRQEIASWSEAALGSRLDAALKKAFWRYQRNADPVLGKLLQLEQHRVRGLIRSLVDVEKAREEFHIAEVEGSLEASIEGVRLSLRFDRIDRLESGELLILDYKTGVRKTFLTRDATPRDLQLVVYACALKGAIGGLALVNIDSRHISFDGAGRLLTPELNWDETLEQWKDQVAIIARQFQRGDVRVNGLQNTQASRPLSLLSRITELRRGD